LGLAKRRGFRSGFSRRELQPDEGGGTPDVTITATRSALARFLTAPQLRDPQAEGVETTGKASAIRTFLKAIEVFPMGAPRRRAARVKPTPPRRERVRRALLTKCW
jgi:hypothetical protein